MKRTKTKLIVLLVLVFAASLIAGIASLFSVKAYAEESSYGYYYEQLTTNEEKAFYSALADMKSQDVFKSGTETWNLVEKGYLENKGYNQTTLTEAFGAGRDAFMLDNSDLFYVDFDKISVRMLTDGSNYKINLGIGRYDNYFADGFDLTNVDKAIADFESIVNKIVDGADGYLGVNNKILYVYETVMDNAVYSLEFDAGDDADYVRCAYGVLVKGKGVCQSFSQAVNIILNKLGIENVLVQGMFIDDDGNDQPNMWNKL
ncbi:MAG: transglutaminase-like domain-containing protein, partial [Clostridia bacterium]|nr:transglutaminase-like domain-containing protein [Clostridia bacterium]